MRVLTLVDVHHMSDILGWQVTSNLRTTDAMERVSDKNTRVCTQEFGSCHIQVAAVV
jgi:hypothetical protein